MLQRRKKTRKREDHLPKGGGVVAMTVVPGEVGVVDGSEKGLERRKLERVMIRNKFNSIHREIHTFRKRVPFLLEQ